MTNEPIAYAAVAADSSESMYVSVYRDRVEQKCREHGWHLVPMYGSPPSTAWQLVHEVERLRDEVFRLRLTDAERDDLEMWLAECLRQCSAATDGGNDELAERWQGRAKRAAAMLERHGTLGSE